MCVRANTSTCGEMQGTFTVWDFLLLLLLACFNLSSLFIFLLRCILKADRGYVSRTYLIFVYVSVDHWVWNVWPLVSCVQTSLIAGSEFGPAACKPVKKSATVCLRVCLQSCGCVWEREREKCVYEGGEWLGSDREAIQAPQWEQRDRTSLDICNYFAGSHAVVDPHFLFHVHTHTRVRTCTCTKTYTHSTNQKWYTPPLEF